MKRIKLIFVFSFIFSSVMATFAGSATNAYVRKVQVDASGNCVYFYTSSHDNTPNGSAATPGHMGEPGAENWGGRWVILNLSDASTKALLSLLLTAKASGLKVNVGGCGSLYPVASEMAINIELSDQQ